MNTALKKFENSLETLGLKSFTDKAERFIVAFSGGADSCLLLHLARYYFVPLGKTVECAHLNHMIRGGEADRDEQFCVDTAKKLGVRIHLQRVDIPALAENGGSLEEVARRERYKFFSSLAAEHMNTVVLTAHNADDNLETVVFNLVRGTSIGGLCGIPPVREEIYLRPLLTFSSEEIRRCCDDSGIDYVTDSTNLQTDYTRNYIRHRVVPVLREINPTPEVSVGRMCSSLRLDREYLQLEAERFTAEKCNSGIPTSETVMLHDSILSRVIIGSFDKAASSHGVGLHLEKKHVDEIIRHIRKAEEKAFSISLPGDMVFRCENKVGVFLHSSQCVSEVDLSETILEFDKPVLKNGYSVVLTKDITSFFQKNENIYNLSIHKSLKFDKIKGNLKIRVRRNGDLFRYGGMTHKVKKIFSENKLSAIQRRTLPIVCDDNGILWIPGFPLRDGTYSGNGDTVYLVCLKDGCQDLKMEC
ncbi:MAG: tRNA lysidine(34) synthetase TilS [Clostridia bacterium]|nr:tRNA lysidine(34) synthetase TilS [Clostridia bacterium]